MPPFTLQEIQPFLNSASPAIITFASSAAGLKLLDWLRDYIGLQQKPEQILNEGKAQAYSEVEAQLIKQSYDFNASENDRLLAQSSLVNLKTKMREQQNKKSVVFKALEALKEMKPDAKPEDFKTEEVDEDFRANFFDKCRLVSDEEMQMLWAKVLVGEINQPGTFSRRTLNLLSSLDKNDANNFVSLCGFSNITGGIPNFAFIYNLRDQIFQDCGLSLRIMQNLVSMGLIHYDLRGFVIERVIEDKRVSVDYFSTAFVLEGADNKPGSVKVGQVMFTDLGKQLGRLCSPRPYPGFEDYLLENWKEFGYKITILREGEPPQEA